MARGVILVERGFQDEEVIYPYYRLLEAGWEVTVASPTGDVVHGKYGVPARVDASIEDLDHERFDAVILPGGFECPDRLRMRKDVRSFVWDMNATGKTVAAICHGPWILISADILKGRAVTGYESIFPDLENAGARVMDLPVVVDGNLITAQHYRYNGDFMRMVLKWTGWGPEINV